MKFEKITDGKFASFEESKLETLYKVKGGARERMSSRRGGYDVGENCVAPNGGSQWDDVTWYPDWVQGNE